MTYDYSKLNGRITEICSTRSKFAELMNLSERSVSLKLNNKRNWKQEEMQSAIEVLNLNIGDIQEYFFKLKVQ